MHLTKWFLCALFISCPFVYSKVVTANPQVDKDIRTKLLEERRDTLKEHLDLMQLRYANGDTTFSSLIAARSAYLESRLDLASTREEKIKLLLDRFNGLRDLEKQVTAAHRAGSGNLADVHLTKVKRIEAEIALLDERAK